MKLKECCRNCKYFDDESCLHPKTFQTIDDWAGYRVCLVSESGNISEAIKESFDIHKFNFDSFRNQLSTAGISAKKIAKTMELLTELLEQMKDKLIVDIDSSVTSAADNGIEDQEKPETIIVDPDNFCCNNYL